MQQWVDFFKSHQDAFKALSFFPTLVVGAYKFFAWLKSEKWIYFRIDPINEKRKSLHIKKVKIQIKNIGKAAIEESDWIRPLKLIIQSDHKTAKNDLLLINLERKLDFNTFQQPTSTSTIFTTPLNPGDHIELELKSDKPITDVLIGGGGIKGGKISQRNLHENTLEQIVNNAYYVYFSLWIATIVIALIFKDRIFATGIGQAFSFGLLGANAFAGIYLIWATILLPIHKIRLRKKVIELIKANSNTIVLK